MDQYTPAPLFGDQDVARVRRNFRRRIVPLLVLMHVQVGAHTYVQTGAWWLVLLLPVSLALTILSARRGVAKMVQSMLAREHISP